jgi:hypothetical protein
MASSALGGEDGGNRGWLIYAFVARDTMMMAEYTKSTNIFLTTVA